MFSLTRYWIRKGDAARDAHQWEAAHRAYARALLRKPTLAPVWVQYGHALKEAGRVAEALAAYRQSDRLRPDVPDTLEHIALAARMIGQGVTVIDGQDRADTARPLTPDQLALAATLRLDMWDVARAVQLERFAPVTIEHLRTLQADELALRLRAQAFFWPTADGVGLCRTIAGRLIVVDPQDFGPSTQLINNGCLDIATSRAVAQAVKPGMLVADIGANLGYSAVLLAEAVGPAGRVMAFESRPAIANMLRRTISLNGYDGYVEVDTRAVAIPPAEAGSGAVQATPAVPLDDVLPPHLDFVRIDSGGGDEQVWAGLLGTIGANPRIGIAMTLNAARLSQAAMPLLMDMQARGFKLRYVNAGGDLEACDAAFVVRQGLRDITLVLGRS